MNKTSFITNDDFLSKKSHLKPILEVDRESKRGFIYGLENLLEINSCENIKYKIEKKEKLFNVDIFTIRNFKLKFQ